MSYGFGNSGPRFNVKKPVELDKEYEADIEDISRRGDGIGYKQERRRYRKNRRLHNICCKH